MSEDTQISIEVMEDLDDDRYFSWEQFTQVVNFCRPFSKMQAFLIYGGLTAFRPIESSRAQITNLLFQDREHPLIQNNITKYKPKIFFTKLGVPVNVHYNKKKKRQVPLWVRDYFEEYIRRNWQTLANDYLFPDGKGGFISSHNWCTLFAKLRKRMITADAVKYSWVNDIVSTQYAGNGTVKHIHRLSMYALRKSRITWYAMGLINQGVADISVCCSQFAGHKKFSTTYTYIKRLIAEHTDGSLTALKPPNLNENILGKDNPPNETDKLVRELMLLPELRELVKTFIKAQKGI